MARVRINGLGSCTERMCELLWLGSSYDVSASLKLRFRFECSLGISDADSLRIGPGISFRVKILCSLWYTETFALWIEFTSGSNVTGSARWWIRFTVRHV